MQLNKISDLIYLIVIYRIVELTCLFIYLLIFPNYHIKNYKLLYHYLKYAIVILVHIGVTWYGSLLKFCCCMVVV